MIARLTGTVLAVGPTWIVVDLAGLGLRALTTPATSASARLGEPITLHTTLVVREDSLTLFAFADADERDASQQHVGSRSARVARPDAGFVVGHGLHCA